VTEPSFHIRLATPEDAAELAQLRYDFRVELDAPTESRPAFVARCTPWMARELSPEGAWRCWVAAAENALVGTLWLQLIGKLPNPVGHLSYHGYVSSVYVVPSRRNAGIGSALLQACLTDAEPLGVDALFLWPSERSRPLYARHGFAIPHDLLERR
jgi:GNAT superfamily N-acetyltransferase